MKYEITVFALLVFVTGLALFAFEISGQSQAQTVHALFNLNSPSTGPFPSDWFTVPDGSQKTRRRVTLPQPDCIVRQSDCEDIAVINTLDGFNVDPRLSIPFDGAIDPTTVSSQTVFLV